MIGRPTNEFPHPLARVPQSAGYRVCFFHQLKYINLHCTVKVINGVFFLFCLIQLSYYVVNLIIWWSIRTFINDFRKKKLKLSPIAYFSTYNGSISHLPTGYMWSPHLVPKPSGEDSLLILLPCCTLSFYYILNGNFGSHISLPP